MKLRKGISPATAVVFVVLVLVTGAMVFEYSAPSGSQTSTSQTTSVPPSSTTASSSATSSSPGTYPPFPTGRRIGFWVADDDVYDGSPTFGNAQGTVPTPQQFFSAYFLTPPYPATMVWTGGLQSSASLSVPPAAEAQWFNQLLSICDTKRNIEVFMIAFINLSGNSIEGGQWAPPASSGYVATGFSVARSGVLTSFTITSAAGLSSSTAYTLKLVDINFNLIGNVATFTTDSTGAASFTAALPNTTNDQANQGGYVVVQGTHVGKGLGWTQDQTTDFTAYMQAIKGHRSFLGVLFEPEYFGNTLAIQAAFQSIVNGAGYYDVSGGSGSGSVGMSYSEYPYYSGQLDTGTAPANDLGVHYGETGTPPGTAPIWTQAVITNIVDHSWVAPITIIIAYNDINNPAGTAAPATQDSNGVDWNLYMSPVLRGWIWSDSNYQSNYVLSTGS